MRPLPSFLLLCASYGVTAIVHSDGVKADAERRSTGGFSPGLAVSEVYDGDWVDDRRCGKGTVTYSNGEVEVCSFQGSPAALGREGTRVGEGMRWDRHGRQAWRLMDG